MVVKQAVQNKAEAAGLRVVFLDHLITESIENIVFCSVLRYHSIARNEKGAATSTLEMVTISRAECEELKFRDQRFLEQRGLVKKQ